MASRLFFPVLSMAYAQGSVAKRETAAIRSLSDPLDFVLMSVAKRETAAIRSRPSRRAFLSSSVAKRETAAIRSR